MNRTEVIIVGGGPAGAYCAFELAKRGIYPLIFDHSHPREKPCGGVISTSVIQKFPFVEKFYSKCSGSTFGDFNIITCTDIQVVANQKKGGFCIKRKCFDWGILKKARQNGAIFIKEKVTKIHKKRKFWLVETEKGLYSAKILVGADGVLSLVRKNTIGQISKENLAQTFGYITTSIKKNEVTMKYMGYIPGYIWILPGNNYSNIGIGSELKYGGRLLKKLLDNFIGDYYPNLQIISQYAGLLPSAKNPNFFRDKPCAGENWILVGDAAGHVDPISGGGILYALWGGKLAAEAIVNNDPKSYDLKWRKEFGELLENYCENKPSFYDPIKSTTSILMGLKNNIYSLPTKSNH
jgi:geranylgeranyl reductase family protein